MRASQQKNSLRNVLRRAIQPLCTLVVAVGLSASVWSSDAAWAQDADAFHEIETKYIFGNFTVGSSTGIEGEKAIEPESKASFGKRGGDYFAGQTAFEFEYTPTQYVQVEFGPILSYYNIQNVADLDNRSMTSVGGFEATLRSVLIDRGPSPIAVTFAIEPEFHSRDETSGESVNNYGLETKLEADMELVKNRLYLGFNALYEPETTRDNTGAWFNESTIGASAALAFQIFPNVVVGVDFWYLAHYQGLSFNAFTGDAFYLGPTFYWKIAPKVLVSAAWEAQVAGRELGLISALNLTDFSRQRASLLLEFEF